MAPTVNPRDDTARPSPGPRNVVLGAIVLQAVAGLACGLPGHLSPDSVVQLFEARTLQFISFQPPMMSLLLRVLDGWVRGTALFVILDQVLLTASFVLLFAARRTLLGWPAALGAAALVLNPVLIAYTGMVWKDVLMSHLAAFGYVCLFVAARRTGGRRMAWALSAVLVLALAASLRQHALVLAIAGAVCAAMLLSSGRAVRWGLALVLSGAVVGANVAIVAYADAVSVVAKVPRTEAGLRSLFAFDLAGIAANGGTIPVAAVADQVGSTFVPAYTPLRNDPLPAPAKGSALWRMETAEMGWIWRGSIAASPGAYLQHRTANFGALLWKSGTTPQCVPLHVGVASAVFVPSLGRDIVPEMGLTGSFDARDWRLYVFLQELLPTPLFNHAFWSIVLAVAAMMSWRRGRAMPLVVLAASALAFAIGFGVIGISCEFRYLYVLPVAATLLLFSLVTGSRGAEADGTTDRAGSVWSRQET